MILTADAKKNRLFAALSDAELARWLPFLEPVDLPPGKVLHESALLQTARADLVR
jgi:hypothetical protein